VGDETGILKGVCVGYFCMGNLVGCFNGGFNGELNWVFKWELLNGYLNRDFKWGI